MSNEESVMSINNATIQVERTTSYPPKRFPFRRTLVIGAATLAVAVVTVVAFAQDSGQGSVRPTVQPAQPAGDGVVRDLVDRGLIPSESLQPAAPSRDDIVRDLVDRGLIPSESLRPAAPSRDDIVQDLVDRGLVPAATPDDLSLDPPIGGGWGGSRIARKPS
jgi:hypothetical protein